MVSQIQMLTWLNLLRAKKVLPSKLSVSNFDGLQKNTSKEKAGMSLVKKRKEVFLDWKNFSEVGEEKSQNHGLDGNKQALLYPAGVNFCDLLCKQGCCL